MTSTMNDNASAITLAPITRIADLARIKEHCDAAAGDLVIDGSAVDSVDAAVLQFLVVLRRHCAVMGRGFRIESPSGAFRHAAECIGFDAALGTAMAEEGRPA